MTYFTYLWLREDGTPFYVGCGTGRRPTEQHYRGEKVLHPPKDSERIITQEFPDKRSAKEGEKLLICVYGRKDIGTGCLMNMTDGGDGAIGCRWNIGRSLTKEHRKKLSEALKGRPKKGHPAWNKGLKGSIPWNKGLTLSDDDKKKISESTRKIMNCEEVRKKMRGIKKPHLQTPEYRAVQSARMTAWWAGRKRG